jgi:hypothetical protein
MSTNVSIVGVYPVEGDEPVHLIEIRLQGNESDFDFADITQEDRALPRENWQAAYDEQLVADSNGEKTFVFFFHYLDFDKPLLTSYGAVRLPPPTETPSHLRGIEYTPP